MNVYVNGVKYSSKTGAIDTKRRFGTSTVLVSSDEVTGARVIAAVDVMGRFLVREGHSYEVSAMQTDRPTGVVEGRVKQAQKIARLRREARRQRANEMTPRRSSSYNIFVREFLRSFLNVSFSDAAKEWSTFTDIEKQTLPTETLIERVRAQDRHQVLIQ